MTSRCMTCGVNPTSKNSFVFCDSCMLSVASTRVVWMARDTVTGGWKTGDEYPTRESLVHACRFLKHWRVVEVTRRRVRRALGGWE